MKRRRFVLAPEAALDLVSIWRYIARERNIETADRVEHTIREKFAFLAMHREAGHTRNDLTAEDVKFFPVFAYLIVYRPLTSPLHVVAILHGNRDVREILRDRL